MELMKKEKGRDAKERKKKKRRNERKKEKVRILNRSKEIDENEFKFEQ